jgi:hypothetical protein
MWPRNANGKTGVQAEVEKVTVPRKGLTVVFLEEGSRCRS